MRFLIFATTLLVAWSVAAGGHAIDAARIDAVEAYLGKLEKLGFSGAVLVAEGKEPALARGYGRANRENDAPWSTRTISTIGSITKQFTGAAILALVEDGRLALDDPITRHFESVPDDKRAITVHQLLTHSSGIVDLDDAGDFDPIGRDEFVGRALEQDLDFEPGTSYAYSNAGYSLLGAIVEQLVGKTYEEFVRERFFLPAEMRDTGYILAGFDPERLAQGYRDGEKWGTVVERDMADDGPYWVLRANGGIHSTLEDMHRWAQHLLQGRALSKRSMEHYWAPHVSEGGDSAYGYGWVVLDLEGHRVITHNGGNGIHFADMAIVPSTGLVIVLQCNVVADFPMANGLIERLGAHLLLGAELPDVPDRADVANESLARYRGRYTYADGGALEIAAADGELQATAADPIAFSKLLSTRAVDPERAARLSTRMDAILSAWLAGDMQPLHEAYGGRASVDRLAASAASAREQWEAEHGRVTGHRVLGTAFRDGRDVTLVRIDCERGHVDRAYVWDSDAHEDLRGVSRRGLDTVLHVLPETDGGFASWDVRSGASRPVDFVAATDGALEIVFGGENVSRARRTATIPLTKAK